MLIGKRLQDFRETHRNFRRISGGDHMLWRQGWNWVLWQSPGGGMAQRAYDLVGALSETFADDPFGFVAEGSSF